MRKRHQVPAVVRTSGATRPNVMQVSAKLSCDDALIFWTAIAHEREGKPPTYLRLAVQTSTSLLFLFLCFLSHLYSLLQSEDSLEPDFIKYF